MLATTLRLAKIAMIYWRGVQWQGPDGKFQFDNLQSIFILFSFSCELFGNLPLNCCHGHQAILEFHLEVFMYSCNCAGQQSGLIQRKMALSHHPVDSSSRSVRAISKSAELFAQIAFQLWAQFYIVVLCFSLVILSFVPFRCLVGRPVRHNGHSEKCKNLNDIPKR